MPRSHAAVVGAHQRIVPGWTAQHVTEGATRRPCANNGPNRVGDSSATPPPANAALALSSWVGKSTAANRTADGISPCATMNHCSQSGCGKSSKDQIRRDGKRIRPEQGRRQHRRHVHRNEPVFLQAGPSATTRSDDDVEGVGIAYIRRDIELDARRSRRRIVRQARCEPA